MAGLRATEVASARSTGFGAAPASFAFISKHIDILIYTRIRVSLFYVFVLFIGTI